MLGIIFSQFRQFVVSRYGVEAWLQLRSQTDQPAVFHLDQNYPDESLGRLLAAALEMTGLSKAQALEEFGRFLVPGLARTFEPLIDPTWDALGLIGHTEELIHQAIRLRHPGASPPPLLVERRSEDEIVLHYGSPRRLCALAKGIARGVAELKGETLLIADLACMDRGDPACRISMRRNRPGLSGAGGDGGLKQT